MSEMKEYTLKDCFSLRARIGWQGLRSDEFKTEGPYLVTGTDFDNGRVNWDGCYHVSVERYAQDKGIQLRENDLLITKDGTIGKTVVVTDCPEKATLNSHIFLVRPLAGSVDPVYLYYVLNSNIFDSFLNNIVTGTTIKGLTQEKFYKFTFAAPDIKEQRRIVEVLRAVDEAIDGTQRIVEKYRRVKEGLLDSLFREGEMVTLADNRYFIVNPKLEKLPNTFYYIDLESVVAGSLIAENHISKISAPSRAKRLLKKNDVLFQLVRPYQQNNFYFDLDSGVSYVASTGYAQIRTNQNPQFIYYSLHTSNFLREVNCRCTGSNYPAINPSELKKIPFYLPNKNIQDYVTEKLISVDKLIKSNRKNLTKYNTIKQGLLQDLLTKSR